MELHGLLNEIYRNHMHAGRS